MKLLSHIAISNTGLIVNPLTGESFTTNPMGMYILNLLNDNVSKSNIKKEILSKYDVDDLTFEKDYGDFINLLSKFKLI